MTAVFATDAAVRRFTTTDGYVHHVHCWLPDVPPRGLVVWLHGIQSHAGWYDWSSGQLAAAGYDVRILDRRGSGRNDVDRGHASSTERLISDVAELLGAVAADRDAAAPGRPVILAGLSWGAKLAAAVAARVPERIDGLLLAYPAIRTHFEPNWWQRGAIRVAHWLGLGRRLVPVPLSDPRLFTDNAAYQQAMRADPLSLHRVSLSFLKATLDLTEQAEAAPQRLNVPTLILLAGRDEIGDTPAMRDWAAGIRPQLLRLIEFPEARHTLEFDRERERYVATVVNWIESIGGPTVELKGPVT